MMPLPFPVRDANTSHGSENLGQLPEWDLSDLYAGEEAPELARDLDWLEAECAAFAADYEGKLASLDAQALLRCVHRNERISAIAGRIMSFAGLRYYQMTIDAGRTKFMSDAQEKITRFTTPLVFFTLELNRLDEAHLQGLLAANADLARYAPVFDRIRAMKPHQLSDEMEKFLHDLGVVGDAWERLFDETIAGLGFEVDGEALNIEAVEFFSDGCGDRSLVTNLVFTDIEHRHDRLVGEEEELFEVGSFVVAETSPVERCALPQGVDDSAQEIDRALQRAISLQHALSLVSGLLGARQVSESKFDLDDPKVFKRVLRTGHIVIGKGSKDEDDRINFSNV